MVNRGIPFLIAVFAYFLGSIPWGVVFTRLSGRGDVRKSGSGNIGATNVRRVAGNRWAAWTLVADVLKGVLPVWAATVAPGVDPADREAYAALVALLAILGHLFPVYFRFRSGGKGVATAAGSFWVLAPAAVGFAGLVFALVTWIGNRVSLGSLAGAAVLPLAVWLQTRSIAVSGCALLASCLIALRHRDNIKRLISGTESVFRNRR